MDDAVVIATLPDAEAAETAAQHLDRSGLDRARIAVIRLAWLHEDRTDAALSVAPGRRAVVVDGFLLPVLFAAIDARDRGSPLLEATLRRAAVPRRFALAYDEAVHHGAALLALRTRGTEIDRTCRALEAAGADAPTVHHFPSTRRPAT